MTFFDRILQRAIRDLTGFTEGNRLVGIISHVAELREKSTSVFGLSTT